eukprot:TRINITY_DN15697_c0_g1_i6.p1 TRINITY_DN15697_c0_g1~~TRINITY_DN15697_c0_g1_i6.p1  ORF type:complete len:212 (+),score=31.20 TRINITY_DN15697_c0_g1_i6:92-637(+)
MGINGFKRSKVERKLLGLGPKDGSSKKKKRALRVIDRQKHNEAESQRRRRMKIAFDELASVCGLVQPHIHIQGILQGAVNKIHKLETRLRELEAEERMLQAKSRRKRASFSSTSTHSQPPIPSLPSHTTSTTTATTRTPPRSPPPSTNSSLSCSLSPVPVSQIGRAVQQECRDRSRMPSSA